MTVSTDAPQQFNFRAADSRAREAAASIVATYEAAEPTRFRKFRTRRGSQNELVQRAGVPLRTQVRHLVRNHDLARGALRTLVNNIAGAQGIGVEPQPRTTSGEIHKGIAQELRELWRDWSIKPEVTHQLPLSRLQRALARSWIRDGEVFGQMLSGAVPLLDHGTRVPFSLEVFEADLVPLGAGLSPCTPTRANLGGRIYPPRSIGVGSLGPACCISRASTTSGRCAAFPTLRA